MTKRIVGRTDRSIKQFLVLLAIIALGLMYFINDTIPQKNHIDGAIKLAAHPKQNIVYVAHKTEETKKQIFCLAQNIFFEARGADTDEKIRVANVTHNRVLSNKYSSTYCGVVFEPSQFSWTKEKHNLKETIYKNKIERAAWEESVRIAEAQVNNQLEDITNNSLFYHTHKVSPKWSSKLHKTISSKWHKYYK